MGFGSLSRRNPRRLTSIVVDALGRADMRGIIATGWVGLEFDRRSEALRHVTGSDKIRRHADLPGQQLRDEDGIAKPVELIEQTVRASDNRRHQ